MKKPLSVLMAQIVLVVICLLRSLNALASLALAAMGGFGSMAGPMGFLINAGLGACAGWLLLRSLRRDLKLGWLLTFLWVDLFAYPLANLLRMHGWYPVGSPIPANQLLGAAIAELLHYGFLLAAIIWLGFSKTAKPYLAGGGPSTSRSS